MESVSSKIIAKAKALLFIDSPKLVCGTTVVSVDATAPTKQAFDNVGLGLPVAQLLVKAALLMFSGGRAN